jgi:hypothetical protein
MRGYIVNPKTGDKRKWVVGADLPEGWQWSQAIRHESGWWFHSICGHGINPHDNWCYLCDLPVSLLTMRAADLPVRCAICGGTEDHHHLAKHVFANSARR